MHTFAPEASALTVGTFGSIAVNVGDNKSVIRSTLALADSLISLQLTYLPFSVSAFLLT